MPALKPLIRELAKHAIAKKGAQQDPSWCNLDVLEQPKVSLAGDTLWTEFFIVYEHGDEPVAEIYVHEHRLKEHQMRYPVIRRSRWLERDGHIQMEVPLNAGLPSEFLTALIDEAYAIAWNKLGAQDRLKIELAGLPYDEPKLMDRLIETHNLQEHRRTIRKLARPAILLRTKQSSEVNIPVGATKIGGRPDLPAETEWPTYRDGKPLAFLAQLNMQGIAKVGAPVKGLPSNGILSIFSVWGWMGDGELDPQPPKDGTESRQEEMAWTVMLHLPLVKKAAAPQSTSGREFL
jgi:predicted DNA-binding protein (MmcQ/YjbR family)